MEAETVRKALATFEKAMDEFEEVCTSCDDKLAADFAVVLKRLDLLENKSLGRIRLRRSLSMKGFAQSESLLTTTKHFFLKVYKDQHKNLSKLINLNSVVNVPVPSTYYPLIVNLKKVREVVISFSAVANFEAAPNFTTKRDEDIFVMETFPIVERKDLDFLTPKHIVDSKQLSQLSGMGLWGCDIDPVNNHIYLSGNDSGTILTISSDFQYVSEKKTINEAQSRKFGCPRGISFSPDGQFYAIVEYSNHVTQLYHADGTHIIEIGKQGQTTGCFDSPYNVAIDMDNYVYVTDRGNNRIQKFDSQGTFILEINTKHHMNGKSVDGIAINHLNLVCAMSWNGILCIFDERGELKSKHEYAGFGSSNNYVCRGFNGGLVVTDRNNNDVYILDADFKLVKKISGLGTVIGAVVSQAGDLILVDRDSNRLTIY